MGGLPDSNATSLARHRPRDAGDRAATNWASSPTFLSFSISLVANLILSLASISISSVTFMTESHAGISFALVPTFLRR